MFPVNDKMFEVITANRVATINRLYEAVFNVPGVKVIGPDEPVKARLEEVKEVIRILDRTEYGGQS